MTLEELKRKSKQKTYIIVDGEIRESLGYDADICTGDKVMDLDDLIAISDNVTSDSNQNHLKCEKECNKTCDTCGYRGENYISCACLTCCNYNRVRLKWKPKESEIEVGNENDKRRSS